MAVDQSQFYAANILTGVIGEDTPNTLKQMRDVSSIMTLVTPDNDASALTAFLLRMTKGAKMTNVKKEWFRKKHFPRWDDVASGTITNNGTAAITFPATNASYLRAGDELEFVNPAAGDGNMNHCVVTGISGSDVTVSSLDGTTTLPSIAEGDQYHIIAFSGEGWGRMPAQKAVKDEAEWNYPQYLRYPTKLDVWELGMKNWTSPNEMPERIAEQRREIMMSAERILHFGERGKRASTNGNQYFARGWRKYAEAAGTQNVLDWSGGSLTQSTWDDWLMNGPMKYGGRTKLGYLSTELWSTLHSWAATKERIAVGGGQTKVLGSAYLQYQAPNGKIINLFQHHMYEQQYEGAGGIIDPLFVKMVPFGDIPLFGFFPNRQENDRAGEANEWQAIFSVMCTLPEAFGWITK